MGWAARRRGPYEQRKANAIMRDRKTKEAKMVENAKRIAAKPPEERVKSRKVLKIISLASLWHTNKMNF